MLSAHHARPPPPSRVFYVAGRAHLGSEEARRREVERALERRMQDDRCRRERCARVRGEVRVHGCVDEVQRNGGMGGVRGDTEEPARSVRGVRIKTDDSIDIPDGVHELARDCNEWVIREKKFTHSWSAAMRLLPDLCRQCLRSRGWLGRQSVRL